MSTAVDGRSNFKGEFLDRYLWPLKSVMPNAQTDHPGMGSYEEVLLVQWWLLPLNLKPTASWMVAVFFCRANS